MGVSQKFTTIDEQIAILKNRHLLFKNEQEAAELLDIYGYYNLINGYKEHYTYTDNNSEFYRNGITFEQIFSLFCLDHNLRDQIMIIMLGLEEQLRSATSYVIAESFGSNQEDYLNFSNYQNRKVSQRFSLPVILETLRKTSQSDKNPIKYHREKYNNVPPWVLFKGVYFGTLVNFIRLQKPKQKEAIISHFYNIPSEVINKHLKDLFTDTLFLCYEYRNLAAHGGRVYNYEPDAKIRITPESEAYLKQVIFNFENLAQTKSLGTLVCLLDLFKNKWYSTLLKKSIEEEVKKHCNDFPEDMDYLMNSIGISAIAHPPIKSK